MTARMIDEIGETDSIEAADRQMMRQVVELGQTLVRENYGAAP